MQSTRDRVLAKPEPSARGVCSPLKYTLFWAVALHRQYRSFVASLGDISRIASSCGFRAGGVRSVALPLAAATPSFLSPDVSLTACGGRAACCAPNNSVRFMRLFSKPVKDEGERGPGEIITFNCLVPSSPNINHHFSLTRVL